MDTGANVSMTNEEQNALSLTGGSIPIAAVHGAPQSAPKVCMALSTILTSGEHIVIDVPGPCVLQKEGNTSILAYAPLKRHGYRVEL
eukprot:649552-Rhodomonas_salina.1